MERGYDEQDEVIDLGAASIETKGPPGFQVEPSALGKTLGIADD